ncbi:DUF2857 domain-containing protein [Salmonella enterica]|uniref:Protein of uncharacterized function (DUF2857) n=4 Tax=Salmonella enterica TaxID=28901 RepID=A0A2X4T0F5_SALER|nr:hypothetical protein N898_21160 [Salmonella enterica subsp. arizonae serovar 62:z36:- str. RKS2983]EAM2804909.1 DUF2857 domain-containing protein [Salmonella enterica]EAN8612943.1 DUF2857 domain-containing protein [Salmonella enterica subsp. arizonae serovar 48:z4,z24:-]EAO5939062.1 DUF2857 domain-containing protein [Salmonella enterica subsp. houtenae serovar 48:g,z51:-]EAO6002121.1 DUF2857 domain-containing protein [Salmonella enterica subsp. arizonae serovar 62:z36:-]EAW3054230.1 DUF2857
MNALLTQIVMELKSGNIRRCEAMGLTLEEIQELNSLTVEDLHYLVNTPVSLLTFRINHTNLNTMLAQARREQTRTQRIDRALTLGGSIELMQHFFGLTATEVSSRRRLVGVVTRQGRSQVPTEEQELAVWQQWKASNVDNLESLDALEAMMLIAEQQDISLTAVWTLTKGWSAA